MEIEILKKGTTSNELYQISIDGHITHTAIKLASDLPAEINLFESNNTLNKPRLTITRKPAWFAAKYDIKRWDNDIIEFRTKSVWKHTISANAESTLTTFMGIEEENILSTGIIVKLHGGTKALYPSLKVTTIKSSLTKKPTIIF